MVGLYGIFTAYLYLVVLGSTRLKYGCVCETFAKSSSSFLPSFGGEFILSSDILNHGPFGISLLRPQALFGISINDPLTHAVFWSIFLNALVFIIISLFFNMSCHYLDNSTPLY